MIGPKISPSGQDPYCSKDCEKKHTRQTGPYELICLIMVRKPLLNGRCLASLEMEYRCLFVTKPQFSVKHELV